MKTDTFSPTHVSGVYLLSNDPDRLAVFYREVIGLPLDCQHEDGANGADGAHHYECDLGTVHFAIHPPRGGKALSYRNDTMSFSLDVESLDAFLARLQAKGIEPAFGPLDLDFGRLAGVHDPDGNTLMLTQLK